MRQLEEKNYSYDQAKGLASLALLTSDHEKALLTALARYPEVLQNAAKYFEPHALAVYLREFANYFHTYYNAEQFIVEDEALRNARLVLINAVKQVLSNGLTLLSVSAPEKM